MKKLLALKNKKGFTLVELIVVIAIIAVLVAIAVPAMTGYIQNAKEQTAASNCRTVVSAASAVNAAKLAEVNKASFQVQVAQLLVGTHATVSDYSKFGKGTYTIYSSANDAIASGDTPADFTGGTIHHVTYTGDGVTATWEAATNSIIFGTYPPPTGG